MRSEGILKTDALEGLKQIETASQDLIIADPPYYKAINEKWYFCKPIIDGFGLGEYAQAMLNGEWRLTHQGIAFNTDGHLQDGQHRLQAVIDSNTPQQFLVYKNMPIDNFSVIDSGRGRKSTDVLYLDGVTNPIQKSHGLVLWDFYLEMSEIFSIFVI